MQTYPIGTEFVTRGKHPLLCEVVDFHVTRNLAGEIVRERYVATHQFCGQTVTDYEVVAVTIARGLVETSKG